MTAPTDAPASSGPASDDRPSTPAPPAGADARAFLRASRQIARAPSADAVAAALIEGACTLAGCAYAAFYAAEPGAPSLRLLDGCALPAGAPRALPRAVLDRPDGAAAQIWPAPPPHAVALPVAGARQAHGLLVCAWPAAPAGLVDDMAGLADDAGLALDRLALAAEAAADNLTLAASGAVADAGLLYGNLPDRLLQAILARLLEVLELGAAAIFLFDEQLDRLGLAASAAGPQLGADAPAALALWQGPALAACAARAATVADHSVPDRVGAADPGPLGAALRAAGAGELLSVPLLAGTWTSGVLQLLPLPGRAVTAAETRALGVLARQAAGAIENARLFAQARADQERTRAVVDATNDAVIMLDERHRPVLINRRARFFFGLGERDLLGQDYEQIRAIFAHILADGERFTSWLAQLLRSQSARTVEEFRTARPESRLLQCFSAPVMDQRDRFLGRILVFRDITREREVDRMKNDFVAIVSHELRTPLTSIQGALQLTLGQPSTGRPGFTQGMSQRAVDLLTISLNNTARLIRLINDILDIAKIEQGRVQLRREPVEPAALCRGALDAVATLASGRDIRLHLELADPLPPVYADRDRAVQVLINLLSNAIKFSPAGQRVLLTARRDGAQVHFAVRDWGRGIAPEDQARLFQKFQQIDSSSTRDVGGTGLGLAISRALVEEHGGRMWLESAPAAGSIFHFTLPAADAAHAAEALPPLVLLGAGPATAPALRDALLGAGLRVSEAEPERLVELAEALRPDLLLAELPAGPGGAELLRQLRADPFAQAAPLVLIAAEAEGARESGALPPDSPPERVAAAALAAIAAPRPLVLVVEDDPHVRPVLVRLLQRQGLRVGQASDGYSALAAAARLRPDVILLDIKMPGLDGYEVLRRLRASPTTAGVRVIILTASDLDEASRARARELAADEYLEKPIAAERLFAAIGRVLAQSEERHDEAAGRA